MTLHSVFEADAGVESLLEPQLSLPLGDLSLTMSGCRSPTAVAPANAAWSFNTSNSALDFGTSPFMLPPRSASPASPSAAVTFVGGSGVMNAAGQFVRPLGDSAAWASPAAAAVGPSPRGRHSGGFGFSQSVAPPCRFVPERSAVARTHAVDFRNQQLHASPSAKHTRRASSSVGRENQPSDSRLQSQLFNVPPSPAMTPAQQQAARAQLLASSLLELQRSGGSVSPRAAHQRSASAMAAAMALGRNPQLAVYEQQRQPAVTFAQQATPRRLQQVSPMTLRPQLR